MIIENKTYFFLYFPENKKWIHARVDANGDYLMSTKLDQCGSLMYMEEKIVTFKVKNDSLAPTGIFRLKTARHETSQRAARLFGANYFIKQYKRAPSTWLADTFRVISAF